MEADAYVPGLTDALPQDHDDLVLVPKEENVGYGGEQEELHGCGVGGTTDFSPSSRWVKVEYEAPAEIAMYPTLPQSNSRLKRQHQLQHQSAEVLPEMSPPKLINRRKRKLKGSSSLNEKYSHMKVIQSMFAFLFISR